MDSELRKRVERIINVVPTVSKAGILQLLQAHDALEAERDALRDRFDDGTDENMLRGIAFSQKCKIGGLEASLTAERERSAKLVEAAERDELAHAHHVTRLVEAINSYHVLARTDDRAERIRRANEVVESLNRKRDIPDIETLAASVHRAYCENHIQRKGEPYWTGGDYSLLDEATKEIDRATVRAVLAALATYRHSNEPAKEEG